MRQAKEFRERSFLACEKELKQIETLIDKAAEKGELSIYVSKLSDGARQSLKDSGFTVKISLVEEHKEEWKIEW